MGRVFLLDALRGVWKLIPGSVSLGSVARMQNHHWGVAANAPRWAISCFLKTNAGTGQNHLTKLISPQSILGQDFDIQRVEVRINQPLSSPFHQRRKTQPQYASIIILTQPKLFWHTCANDPPQIARTGPSPGAEQSPGRLPAGGSTLYVSKPAVPGMCELSFPGVRAPSALPQRRVGHYVPGASGNRTLRNVR